MVYRTGKGNDGISNSEDGEGWNFSPFYFTFRLGFFIYLFPSPFKSHKSSHVIKVWYVVYVQH